jgi:DNA-binding FrmR family transcriptional regulator
MQYMKNNKQLIRNIIGQLEGVSRMMEKEEDCQKVIIQMKAARSAMASVMEKYLKNSISLCLQGVKNKKKSKEMEKIISELIRNK